MDWPAFRPHVELAVYGEEDPVPVEVADLADLATVGPGRVPATIRWDRIGPDGFERLLARLLDQSGAYLSITRFMNVKADGLLAERHERVIVQAKH
jgi:hypothetical protein